jgi:integrase
MSDHVHETFVSRRALGNTTYIFPSNSRSGFIADPGKALKKVAVDCGIKVALHDLRRTYVTAAASTPGITAAQIKNLVNHTTKDVTGGYMIFDVESLREPAQLVADRLKRLCGIEPIEGVEKITRVRK